jgi:hypothetical protein
LFEQCVENYLFKNILPPKKMWHILLSLHSQFEKAHENIPLNTHIDNIKYELLISLQKSGFIVH